MSTISTLPRGIEADCLFTNINEKYISSFGFYEPIIQFKDCQQESRTDVLAKVCFNSQFYIIILYCSCHFWQVYLSRSIACTFFFACGYMSRVASISCFYCFYCLAVATVSLPKYFEFKA